MIIRDPNTGEGANVNNDGQLVVRAIQQSELEHSSIGGKGYSWDSTELDIDAGDTMLFVKNLGDTPLILDRLSMNGSNVVCTWTILLGSLTTTPAGTLVTPANINNRFSGSVPDAIAYSDETAVADGVIVDRIKTAVETHHDHNLEGIILEKNQYIQVNQVTESTSGSVVVYGHFEVPS